VEALFEVEELIAELSMELKQWKRKTEIDGKARAIITGT
jgi:hypothetical protein